MLWRRLATPTIGAIAAFLLGFWYVSGHPLDERWFERLLGPSLNFACAGYFGPIRLVADSTPSERNRASAIGEFLYVRDRARRFSCEGYPRVQSTSIAQGVAINVEQPLYIMATYAAAWRVFGVDWSVTYWIVGVGLAASFLVLLAVARPFMPTLAAAGLVLAFLASPTFIPYTLSPRDTLKFPFVMGISALLIALTSRRRRPGVLVTFAASVGLLIGVGYGFRSDLYFLMFPAAFLLLLATLEAGPSSGRWRALALSASVRAGAMLALIVGFCVGGAGPLLNDRLYHADSGDAGFHVMAMGLYGGVNPSLYLAAEPNTEGYLYRNAYGNDLAAGLRILEYGWRNGASDMHFSRDGYWKYARKFYFAVVRLVPSDLLARGLGNFVNMMTLPASAMRRPPQLTFDPQAPWAHAYEAWRGTALHRVAEQLDDVQRATVSLSMRALLFVNLVVLFAFLCMITTRFGIRAAIATLILLGSALMVTALKFEMRHIFYIYAFPMIAWGAVGWAVLSGLASYALRVVRGVPVTGQARAALTAAQWPKPVMRQVAIVMLTFAALFYSALQLARLLQVNTLEGALRDLLQRRTVAARYEVQADPPNILQLGTRRTGFSRIRILSPFPSSTTLPRSPGSDSKGQLSMGVAVLDIDGAACHGRRLTLTALGDAEPNAATTGTAFLLEETFRVTLSRHDDYVAFLPAFTYLHEGTVRLFFAGIDVETANLDCIRSVRMLDEFKPDDVLFDAVVPKSKRPRTMLYQRVRLPGLGNL